MNFFKEHSKNFFDKLIQTINNQNVRFKNRSKSESDMENLKSQVFRIFLLFFLILALISTLLQVNLYFITGNTLKEQLGNKCLGVAISVATLLEQDTDSFRGYLETLDTSSDYYLRIKADMEKIRFGNRDNLAFLYVERRVSETEMMYVLDGEYADTDTFAPPGAIEPMTPTRARCYDTGKPFVGDFVTTVWGTLLSAYVPVHDRNTGELLAIVGADVSIGQYDSVMRNQWIAMLINALVFTVLALIVLLISSTTIEKKLFTDSLTGVYNRGFFFSFLRAQLKAIKQKDYPVILFMADLDHFKQINDTYGHPFGDKVLSNVSAIMNAHMRKTDCLARYGGEEFAGIMPGLNMEQASEVIQRIHDAVGAAPVSDEEGSVRIRVTISIGVAQLNRHESINNAIKRADTALYEAKKTRNAVIFDRSTEK